ncbi:hotdog domain-containing protein [Gordonia sp. PKS22-38]|uniref:Hotdog domain-containing protein n=1 Tax=Gordonia prachuapensis TaxID=3115651 RepID=A0ABU7MMD3_9ACTN|nr:hotdog domain-containing protein [Gordonia sp. PKS22-38]
MVAEPNWTHREPPNDPVSAFGIGNVAVAGRGRVVAEQQLGPLFTDHRGRIDLPALAVLFDHLGGLPYFRSGPSTTPCVQARLSMAMQGHVGIDDRITATADLMMRDDSFGSTRVDITTSTGHVCCTGTARNVAVGRSYDEAPSKAPGLGPTPGTAYTHGVDLPPAIEPHLSGREIVEQIASGALAGGPIVDLLNGRVALIDHDRAAGVRFTVTTEPWMGNLFGTMHGGVIASVAAQACSFAGQANAAAGVDYQLGDLAIGFLRSPAVRGTDVVVEVAPIKVGRRIASFEATMRAQDGLLLSTATADVIYR